MRNLRLSALFILSLLSPALSAQFPVFNFHNLGSEQGLHNSNIFNIHQHPNGIVYISTQNGIYSYDGYTFTSLNIDSLQSNALLSACVKDSSSLYISVNDAGIAEYNLRKRTFHIPRTLRYTNNNSDQFIITADFAYLLSKQIRLTAIDLQSGKVIKDEVSQKDPLNLAYCLLKTRSGKIFLGRRDGLYQLVAGKQLKLNNFKNMPVHSLAENAEGKLIVGSNNRILILNNEQVEKEFPLKIRASTLNPAGEKSVDNILADRFGRIWFTSFPDDRLYLLYKDQVADIFELQNIPPALIRCLYKDRDENIWAGTLEDGIYVFQNTQFTNLGFAFNGKTLSINKVLLRNNLLLAGTNNGLYAYNTSNGQAKTLSKPDAVFTEPVSAIHESGGIIYYSRLKEDGLNPSIFLDAKHTYRIRPVPTGQFYPLSAQHLIITGRLADVLQYNVQESRVQDTLISFPHYRITVNDFMKRGDSLLIATSSGLYIYSFSARSYSLMTRADVNFPINDLELIDGKIFAAHEAGISNIDDKWLINEAGGLKLGSVRKIAAWKDQIWLGSNEGVIICNKALQPRSHFSKATGLPSSAVNDIIFSEETVCIATGKGLALAKLSDISNITTLRPIVVDKIKVNGNDFGSDGNLIRLSADQENLQIQFYSPLYNRSRQFFRYRINDGGWNLINDNSVSLSIATGGRHRLEISASSDNINWSEPRPLVIQKEQSLAETVWLYWLVTLGGIAMVVAVSAVIVRRIKSSARKRLEVERQVNLLKHQAMNSLLSPHFIFNSLTSIQNYINSNNGLKASEYLAKFSRLIRMIIEKASQSEITLSDELTRLNYYLDLEKERFKNKFDYSIQVDERLNQSEIKIPNMIIQPHVENCIIHGILPKMEHGKLSINFSKIDSGKLQIRIEDDGIGLIKAKEHAKTGHKSLGTSTIRNILEINSKLSGKQQQVSMVDKSTLHPPSNGTLILIELEL